MSILVIAIPVLLFVYVIFPDTIAETLVPAVSPESSGIAVKIYVSLITTGAVSTLAEVAALASVKKGLY